MTIQTGRIHHKPETPEQHRRPVVSKYPPMFVNFDYSEIERAMLRRVKLRAAYLYRIACGDSPDLPPIPHAQRRHFYISWLGMASREAGM